MGKYKLIWSDEFDYDGLPDSNLWTYDVGGHGFGNKGSQYFTENRLENAKVENGKLIITALKEDYEDNAYTSARLTTRGKHSWQYGRFEIKAKIPNGVGSWTALWMLPDSFHNGVDWPLCGEIDLMEHLGRKQDEVHFSLHTGRYNHMYKTEKTHVSQYDHVSDEFKVYSMDWTKDYIEFFVDGVSSYKVYKGENGDYTDQGGWPFDQKFYLIFNIAVGGDWGGQIKDQDLPYVMEIDYVRVYEIMEEKK